MKKFDYLEDYILAISGAMNKQKFFPYFDPIISLARYDKPVLENFFNQIHQQTGFTSKQADLAAKIVSKYARQLKDQGYDITPVVEGAVSFKYPIRAIDYSKTVSVEENQILARFPYNEKLISNFREFANRSQGYCKWSAPERTWQLALTEGNLVWALDQAKEFNLTVDPTVMPYIDICYNAVDITPTLKVVDGQVVLENFPDSMVKFLTDKLGDIGLNNIVKVADYSAVCYFDLDKSVEPFLTNSVKQYVTNRSVTNPPIEESTDSMMQELCRYIKETDRYPVVIFDPHQVSSEVFSKASLADRFISHYGTDGVLFYNHSVQDQLSKYRVIVTNSVAPEFEKIESIGLLISANGLMLNAGRRQMLLQKSEKVVFFAHHSNVE